MEKTLKDKIQGGNIQEYQYLDYGDVKEAVLQESKDLNNLLENIAKIINIEDKEIFKLLLEDYQEKTLKNFGDWEEE